MSQVYLGTPQEVLRGRPPCGIWDAYGYAIESAMNASRS